ncbi:MAG TPA: carbonic anhydrase, partial [Alphaproteobacteria bacterium]|nr:carbonic anhydrase [Alphaproteobacteria bacterium]
GWWFDMSNGALWAYEDTDSKFMPLVPAKSEQD